MAIIDMLSWWYTTGWGVFTRKLGNLFASLADFFSISSLLRTLFQPYRQISAGETSANASLDSKFHAFIDRLISRCVGFVSRLLILVVGFIIITVSGTIGIVTIVIWPLIPCLPIAGIILTCTGFML
ncbi:hypothetical protein IJJ36_01350 [Candidatus Saccharibacteria bacterium]|nr:hypothetical protein [Candidatus Saccharibacteria bacterium]MBR3264013.1 hypothetical protein [Candidatus Saccharibacteria bacterium]